jgi:membrane-bound lytic murein transglycosylase MltF
MQKPYLYVLIASLMLLAFAALYYSSHQRAPNVRNSKELVVVTHNAAGTYYVDGKGNLAGLEYDLAMLFAKDLGED